MNPTVKFENGNLYLVVDADTSILELVKSDEKLLDTISCLEPIIKNVMDQVLDGYTELVSHGSIGTVTDVPYTEIQKARRRIAEESSDIAKKEIEELCKTISELEEELADCKRRALDYRY